MKDASSRRGFLLVAGAAAGGQDVRLFLWRRRIAAESGIAHPSTRSKNYAIAHHVIEQFFWRGGGS